MDRTLYQAAALILPLVFAIVCHEVAHGWVALALGDPTAQNARRLTLNPLRHVDPIGTIVLPGMLALAHAPVFGWAKPVPVNARRLRHPRRDMMLVGAAGPAMNFVLALIGALALGLLLRDAGSTPGNLVRFLSDSLVYFIAVNVSLGIFNLLPIPPFDGSHIVEGLLPLRAAIAYSRLRPYGMPLMLVLLLVLPLILGFSIVSQVIGPPFMWVAGHYAALVEAIAGLSPGSLL
jgi:Zn-dependent protease